MTNPKRGNAPGGTGARPENTASKLHGHDNCALYVVQPVHSDQDLADKLGRSEGISLAFGLDTLSRMRNEVAVYYDGELLGHLPTAQLPRLYSLANPDAVPALRAMHATYLAERIGMEGRA